MHDWSRRILAFDTETTGIDENARVVEFAAVLFEDGAPTKRWSMLINPGDCDWSDPKVREAMGVNEIDRRELAIAPTFAQVFPQIREALSSAPIRCAHNCAFDTRMMRQEFARAVKDGTVPEGVDKAAPFAHVTLCTLALDLGVNPGQKSRSLTNVTSRWAIPYQNAHRAEADAEACGRVLLALTYALPADIRQVVLKCRAWQKDWERIMAERRRS